MTYTFNNKASNLDNISDLSINKKLSVHSMASRSLDEIINLYRDGYRLEELDLYNDSLNADSLDAYLPNKNLSIVSMAISPTLRYIIVTRPGGIGTLFQVLVENTGPMGMVRFKVYTKPSGSCIEDPALQNDVCIPSSSNVYISGLYTLVRKSKSSGSFSGIGGYCCLRTFTCSAGENCGTTSCGTWGTSISTFNDNIQVAGALGNTPTSVTFNSPTLGNGTIEVSWTDPNNAPIFAHHIVLKRVSDNTTLADGYIYNTNLSISNLTNGTQYSITVGTVSEDGLVGPTTTLTATPNIIIPVLTSITISPISTPLNIGSTQQITAVCRDQNNNLITCGTITWHTSDSSKVTTNPGTGLTTTATAITIGTSNITATSGLITSNTSVITVLGTTPVLTTIAISPASASLGIGATQQLSAICRDQNANIMTCPALTWLSSNTGVTTVNSSGWVTGIGTGTSNITASHLAITSNISGMTVSNTGIIHIAASSNVKYSSNDWALTSANNWTKVKEIIVTESYIGSWRISFEFAGDYNYDCSVGDCPGWAQIYKNGLPYGTIRSNATYENLYYSEDFTGISITNGDKIQIYAYTQQTTAAVVNFAILFDYPPGDAYFTSTPSVARIWIDGSDTGLSTPATVPSINSGSRNYTLKLTGYADASGTFAVTSGITTTVPTVVFAPSAYFTSSPSGATIWIEGSNTSLNTPNIITGLIEGPCNFKLKLTGYVDFQGSFSAVSGATTIVPIVTLTSASGICPWITSKGWSNLATFDIMTLVSAYLGQTNLGFTVTAAHIMGGVAYYLGNLSSGNSLTGCPF